MMSESSQLPKDKIEKELTRTRRAAEKQAQDPARSLKTIRQAAEKAERKKASLGGIWSQLKLMIALGKAYFTGAYRAVPYKSIVAILAGLLYFYSPIDVILDFIPIFGFLDDIYVLQLVYAYIREDLQRFADWQLTQSKAS
jgi:uncharacterized membrane protein YkvA (DUF1232 family)